jgi:predicted dehydrogenase
VSSITYRAAIVGLAGISADRPAETPQHALYGLMPRSHAAAYHLCPQTEVVAVCDVRPELLQAFQQQWQDVWPNLRLYTDYRDMLARERPELVSVATPDDLHADMVVDAAQGGARAILCEKPIATTLADADRMIAAAEANGVLLSVEHTRRWDPKYRKAREMAHSGELGALRTIALSLYSPRAMLFRNGTHMVDMICFLAGADAAWVSAELGEGFDSYATYRGDGGHAPSSEPSASAYIHFANGVRAQLNLVKTRVITLGFELACDDGLIRVSDLGLSVVKSDSHGEPWSSPILAQAYAVEFQLAAVAELIRVLEHGGELVSPARDARNALEIMLAMLRSHQVGNARVNLPIS